MSGVIALASPVMVLAVLSVLPTAAQQDRTTTTKDLTVRQSLDAIDKLIDLGGKAESMKAAAKLKEIGKRDMDQNDRDTWLRLSRDEAIRTCDLRWLENLRTASDPFPLDNEYMVLLAYSKLTKANISGASAVLDELGHISGLSVREQRRVEAIRARIAQIRGDATAERCAIEQMIGHLPSWPKLQCQSCHESVERGPRISGLPVKSLWFCERYIELLQKRGDANDVYATSSAQLKANSSDDNARIRAAMALLALDRHTEADALLRQLPWVQIEGRPLSPPHMLVPFP